MSLKLAFFSALFLKKNCACCDVPNECQLLAKASVFLPSLVDIAGAVANSSLLFLFFFLFFFLNCPPYC